jgi:hypothetical protein
MVCGATPAALVNFRIHIGLLLAWINRRERGVYCREHGLARFKTVLITTLLTGWWGILSLLILNPLTIIANIRARSKLVALSPGPGAGGAGPRVEPPTA